MKTTVNRRGFLRRTALCAAGILAAAPTTLLKAQRSVMDRGLEAQDLLAGRRFGEAIPVLRQALSADPENEWLRGMLARAYIGNGYPAEAVAEFRRILRANPDNDLARAGIDYLTQRPLPRLPSPAAPDSPLQRDAAEELDAYLQRIENATPLQDSRAGRYRVSRIVIDAGHGGFDPGAVGAGGLEEKFVTFAAAQQLEKTLRRRAPRLRVDQTRRGDYYVPLGERTVIANQHKADLFISLHCNAHTRKGARGSESYYCSQQASSAEARRVAELENAPLRYDPPPAAGRERFDIETILFQMERQRYWEESARLAGTIQRALARHARIPDRGTHSADFFVLRKARMPAVLLELGFISNAAEAQLLRSRETMDQLANLITDGVLTF